MAVKKALHVLGGKCQETSSPFTFHLGMPRYIYIYIYHMAHKYTCDMCTHTCCIHLDFHGNTFASPFFHTRKKRPPGESQVQSCGTRSRIINEGGEPHSKFDKWEGFFGWHLPFYTFLKQKQTSKKSTFPKGLGLKDF